MKVTTIVAESATNHPDGTVSMLRAGINRVWNPTLPVPLAGALVVRIEPDLSEGGTKHTFTVRIMNDDGQDIAPKLEGNFEAPQGGGAINIVLSFHIAFPRYGRYGFHVNVDNQRYDSWMLEVTSEGPVTRKS